MSDRLTPTPDREFPQSRLQQRKEQLLSEIQAEQQNGLRRTRRRRLTVAAGTAVAAVAVAVTVVALLPAGSGGPSPAAAAVLHRLARLVAAQPLTPQPGQYLFVDSRNDYPTFAGGTACETVAADHRQIWIGADGSGLIRDTTGPQHYSSPAAKAACVQADSQLHLRSGGSTSNDWFAPRCLSLGPTNNWNSLSSDPHVLLQQMRQLDGGPPTPGEDFVHIGDFLRETDAPPAVRATLYQAAALIPGIELLGTVRDHNGRPGLGIAYPSQGPYPRTGSSSQLIFNPKTGELSGEQGPAPTTGPSTSAKRSSTAFQASPRYPQPPLQSARRRIRPPDSGWLRNQWGTRHVTLSPDATPAQGHSGTLAQPGVYRPGVARSRLHRWSVVQVDDAVGVGLAGGKGHLLGLASSGKRRGPAPRVSG